jgi:hypothetical protein
MATLTRATKTVLVAILLIGMARGYAEEAPHVKSTFDGVYTSSQAARGKESYEKSCASCHRADLSGFSGPPLKGQLFLDRWREFNLNILVNFIENQMPNGDPKSLREGVYLDISAYILQMNSLPSGPSELTSAALPVTLLVGPGGPKPLPSSAQVTVVGCLVEDTGNGFFFTAASEPVRTLDIYQLSPEELKEAKVVKYGSQVFRLEDLAEVPGLTPEGVLGFKAVAKGILVWQPKGARINVTALSSLNENCDPSRDADKK